MNKKSKLLPQLNELFLRRQQYTSHKKNILNIKKRRPITIKQQFSHFASRQASRRVSLYDSKVTQYSKNSKQKLLGLPQTIMERSHSLSNSFDWMSPFERKRQFDYLKQNLRVKQRMNTYKSQLSKNRLQKDYQKFAKIKQRIMKYQVNPQFNKAVLKSQQSLSRVCLTPKIGRQTSQNTQSDKSLKGFSRNSVIMERINYKRKQTSFSEFVKKTESLKKQKIVNRLLSFNQHSKSIINYSKVQKNLQQYAKKYDKRLKTQLSRVKNKLETTKKKQNNNSFSITQIDV